MLVKNILYGYYDTQCLYAVCKLNIAEHLNEGAKSAAELAKLTHSDEKKLYRIMRFLSAKGLFDENDSQIFSLNNESRFLLSSTQGNLKNFIYLHGEFLYQGAAEIYKSTQKQASAFEIKFGKSAGKLFKEMSGVGEAGETYNLAMREASEYYGSIAIEQYDFSPYKTVVDVGGGLGSFLVNILCNNEKSNGINFDLPSLKKDAESYFKENNITSRCQYIGGSFFDEIPKGGDLYIFKAIFHGKTDEQALVILNNCKRVLAKMSKIILVERVFVPGGAFLDACINDINMLSLTSGRVRSINEYKALFDQVGLSVTKVKPLEDSLHIIELMCFA